MILNPETKTHLSWEYFLVSLWKNLLRTVKACDGHGELQERPNETPVEMFGTLVLLTIDGHWWWPFFIIFPSAGVARLGAWKWFLDLFPGSWIFFLLQMVRGKIWRIWSSWNYCEVLSATVLLFTGSFCKLTMQVIDLCYIFVRVFGFKTFNLTFFSPVCTLDTWGLNGWKTCLERDTNPQVFFIFFNGGRHSCKCL